jgi:hypothetical protein
MRNVVGIALNGVPIYGGFDRENQYDAIDDPSSNYNLDQCLGNISPNGIYHYYGYSPCILPGISGSDGLKYSTAIPDVCPNIA